MSEVMAGICKIGVFLICAQTIVHFRPKAAYEKYLKLLLGIMIVVQFAAPLKNVAPLNGEDFWSENLEALWDFEEVVVEGALPEKGEDAYNNRSQEESKQYGEAEEGCSVQVEISEVHIAPIQVEVGGW